MFVKTTWLPFWFLVVFYPSVQFFLCLLDSHKLAYYSIVCHMIPVLLQGWIIQYYPQFSIGLGFIGSHISSILYSLTFVFCFLLLSVFLMGPLLYMGIASFHLLGFSNFLSCSSRSVAACSFSLPFLYLKLHCYRREWSSLLPVLPWLPVYLCHFLC